MRMDRAYSGKVWADIKRGLSGCHSSALFDGTLVAHDEENRANDPERDFQPAVDHELEFEVGQGDEMEWPAPDREQVEEEAADQSDQIADPVVIEYA